MFLILKKKSPAFSSVAVLAILLYLWLQGRLTMDKTLYLYNTLTRKKEVFTPLHPPFVGMYVCGPTVYGEAHLGHARPAITFDVLFRYLTHLGYKVRYVRNITDVGHLENDADSGEDKIAKRARLLQLEPMEVVQQYTNNYHRNMDLLNVLSPSIEPAASGHIFEQQALIQRILDNGYAYVSNGSVYFDIEAYHRKYRYGILSGRNLEELMSETRQLEGQEEKRNPFDFALWKKASPRHIMRWPSPWSEGFPGWHLECSAMSMKYLGQKFDIHGGGMDLLFPHHECEIAQTTAANGEDAVRYWIHNNMITINGQKMGKSLGNFITLNELFTGTHTMLEKAYSPMTIRFFILQAHYRSTLDFSNEALQAAEKGFDRLMSAFALVDRLPVSETASSDMSRIREKCYEAMNDDLNTPVAIAHLFEAVKYINAVNDGNEKTDTKGVEVLRWLRDVFIGEILGLKDEKQTAGSFHTIALLADLLLELRQKAREKKDFATSDRIRDVMNEAGIEVKDKKDGFEWRLK